MHLIAPTTELPVVIVGAGPAGLAAARALAVRDIPYVQLERHTDVGGIWDLENPGTPMYESAHFISSRDTSGFFDVPMPGHFADYPTNREVLEYTRAFADRYGLRERLRCGVDVHSAHQDDDGLWQLQTSAGPLTGSALICCGGVTWDPNLPEIPGAASFTGEIRHSVDYRKTSEFAGRSVLVVGLGNSGADIACDAAANAERAWISTRRGYHFVPKYLMGKPSDQVGWMPIWAERLTYEVVRRVVIGDVRRWGLPKPDHKLFETHPLLNTQLLHHLQHGDITATCGVERFDGADVVFTDGTRISPDVVLFATGYRMSIPFIPRDYAPWSGERPKMFLNVIGQRPGLFGISYIEVNSSAYTLFDRLAHVVASHLQDIRDGRPQAQQLRQIVAGRRPDLSGGVRFVASDRHANYMEVHALRKYLKELHKRMGWQPLRTGMFDGLQRDAAASGRRPAVATPAGSATTLVPAR